jgi:plasmid stabilization system protein ParE
MPEAWSDKDERKYEHIKESSEERGVPAKRAKEIAARTVNKGRRQEGRTPNKTSQGTGNPNRSLEQRTVEELRNRASSLKIPGRSKMNKQQLVQAIRKGKG